MDLWMTAALLFMVFAAIMADTDDDVSTLQDEVDGFCKRVATPVKQGQRPTVKAVSFLAVLTKRDVFLGDNATVKFDRVQNNVGEGYNSKTGIFRAPVAGIYIISASVMSEIRNSMHLKIMKNDEMLSMLYSGGNTYPLASQTLNVPLSAGDEVRVQRHTGRYLHAWADGPYNTFSAALIVLL